MRSMTPFAAFYLAAGSNLRDTSSLNSMISVTMFKLDEGSAENCGSLLKKGFHKAHQ